MEELNRRKRPNKHILDYSRQTEKTFVEVPPYAVNEETGEFINKSKYYKLIPGRDFNVYEKIQSFKNDVDIYYILAKVQQTGDTSLLNRSNPSFMDMAGMPDNLYDLYKWFQTEGKKFQSLPEEIKKAVSDPHLSSSGLNDLISDLVKKELARRGLDENGQKLEVKEDGSVK